ncbi:hypothetical protein ABW19_dt0208603 [Dactylella cylindrospora]|nr:hypothetical protein ABW19_dt0208603 [Dactylella cylindrospora]
MEAAFTRKPVPPTKDSIPESSQRRSGGDQPTALFGPRSIDSDRERSRKVGLHPQTDRHQQDQQNKSRGVPQGPRNYRSHSRTPSVATIPIAYNEASENIQPPGPISPPTVSVPKVASVDLSDITLVVGENPSKTFRLHRRILIEYSGFFRDVFNAHNIDKLYLTGTEIDAFEHMIHWIYHGDIPRTKQPEKPKKDQNGAEAGDDVPLSKVYLAATSFTVPSLQNAIAKTVETAANSFSSFKPSFLDRELFAKKEALFCIRAMYLNATDKQMEVWKVRDLCWMLITKMNVAVIFELLEEIAGKGEVEMRFKKEIKNWLGECGLTKYRRT